MYSLKLFSEYAWAWGQSSELGFWAWAWDFLLKFVREYRPRDLSGTNRQRERSVVISSMWMSSGPVSSVLEHSPYKQVFASSNPVLAALFLTVLLHFLPIKHIALAYSWYSPLCQNVHRICAICFVVSVYRKYENTLRHCNQSLYTNCGSGHDLPVYLPRN